MTILAVGAVLLLPLSRVPRDPPVSVVGAPDPPRPIADPLSGAPDPTFAHLSEPPPPRTSRPWRRAARDEPRRLRLSSTTHASSLAPMLWSSEISSRTTSATGSGHGFWIGQRLGTVPSRVCKTPSPHSCSPQACNSATLPAARLSFPPLSSMSGRRRLSVANDA